MLIETMNLVKMNGTCHKDVYQNSRLRLEYAYLLFDKFIMNRINSELIKIGQRVRGSVYI